MFNREKHKTLSGNISRMYISTSVSLIIAELTSIIAVFVDGLLTSRFLGPDVYSGISVSMPLINVFFRIAGFLSAGCTIGCSRFVGAGKKNEANKVFNLTLAICAIISIILVGACILFPEQLLTLCGVDLNKYPELQPHIFGYLNGYLLSIPSILFITVMGQIIVMDNDSKLFTGSSVVVLVSDVIFDLLNIFIFHGGAFGMGLATSIASIAQLLVLSLHFFKKDLYYKVSLKQVTFGFLPAFMRDGSPSLLKKVVSTLGEILINRITIMVAVTTAALVAKGIQNDIYYILLSIPTGMSNALVSMAGIYYSADDRKGLRYLYSYAVKLGFTLCLIPSVLVFIAAPMIARIYTNDPEAISLTITSLKWLSIGLLCTTSINLIESFQLGTQSIKHSNLFNLSERLIVPVATCFILGRLYGSVGVLASYSIGEIIFLIIVFVSNCVKCKGIPKDWLDIMFLPKNFGGADSDNLYGTVITAEDAVRESENVRQFCLEHNISSKKANLLALYIEEMSIDAISRSKRDSDSPRIEFRLYIKNNNLLLSIMDLGSKFDPVSYYKLHGDEDLTRNIGLRTVVKTAKEVKYYNSFNSNNIMISL